MNTIGSRRSFLASFALVSLFAAGPAIGANLKVVAPAALASAEGSNSRHPGSGSLRLQHLFLASEFAGVPAANTHILSWNYRADSSQTQAVDWTFPDHQIWMSTTSQSSLSSTFASNRGADTTLVFDGAATFGLTGAGPAGGPRDFGTGVQFQTPFRYDPSQGNLLIEVLTIGDFTPLEGVTIDTQSTAAPMTVVTDINKPNSTTGNQLNSSPAAQFEFGVPEPSALALAALALICGMPRPRKR
jgi:hypothetical protein